MRLVSWNLHGALRSRAGLEKQHRAWAYMRDLRADVVLAQEVSDDGIPAWAHGEWTILAGEQGCGRKTWRWGSVIAARPGLNLRPRPDALDDPWLAHLYDLVLVGEVDVPGAGPVTLASVHTPAQSVPSWLVETGLLVLPPEDLKAMKRPGYRGAPYINDFAFSALDRYLAGRRFVVGGDWNTARSWDGPKSRPGTAFFTRAADRGWSECHRGPEEPSYWCRGKPSYQADHVFCDATTAASVTSCRVHADEVVWALSDHAPLVTDFGDVEAGHDPRGIS